VDGAVIVPVYRGRRQRRRSDVHMRRSNRMHKSRVSELLPLRGKRKYERQERPGSSRKRRGFVVNIANEKSRFSESRKLVNDKNN
jgi:hypothetical protein